MTQLTTPPHDVDAEQEVLGACIQDQEALNEIVGTVKPEEFYEPRNRMIFEAIQNLFFENNPVDPVSVKNALPSEAVSKGAASYIAGVLEKYSFRKAAVHAAKLVRDKATYRRLLAAGLQIQNIAYEADGNLSQSLDAAEASVFDVAGLGTVGEARKLASTLSDAAVMMENRALGNVELIDSGFVELNRYIGGFAPGSVTYIGARPSIGKTALGGTVALHAARMGVPTCIVSLEMTREELAMRFLSQTARVPSERLRFGEDSLKEEDWTRLSKALASLSPLPLWIDDHITGLFQIKALARRMKARHGLQLLIIDYLQLLDPVRKTDNRQQEVADLSRGFKLLARDLRMAVVCCAQLNRGVELRKDKKPTLADFKESGAPEQDADVVLLLHRPEFYNAADRPGEADCIVAKHRNGPTGTARLTFVKQFTLFADRSVYR